MPDLMTTAKGLTNGSVPMGAVFAREHVYEAFMQGPEQVIELFHGYTYSGHPVAAAAALATLDIYEREGLFARAGELAGYWEEAVHGLRDHPNVIDIRNLGLVAGIELAPREGAPGARAFETHVRCFEQGALVRFTGDIIALSPPLTFERAHIDELVGILGDVLKTIH
jgi:beta-alanine--pyruvate transaminase